MAARKSPKQPVGINDAPDAEAAANESTARAANISRVFAQIGFAPVRQGTQHGIVQEYQKEYIENTGVRTLVVVVLDTGLAGSTPISVRSFVVTRQTRIDPDVDRLLSLPQSEPIRDMVALLNGVNGPGEMVNAITVRCAVCKIDTAEYRPLADGTFACHGCVPAKAGLTIIMQSPLDGEES